MAQITDYLVTEKAQLTSMEALRAAPGALLGVSPEAVGALKDLAIPTVFDLAASRIFANAVLLSEAATDPRSMLARFGMAPADVLEALPPGVSLDQLRNQPISILDGIGAVAAAKISKALSVSTVRDLALWPPYLAARAIVRAVFYPDQAPGGDADAPADLLPKSGEFPTERVFYSTLVFDGFDGDPGQLTPLNAPVAVNPVVGDAFGFTKPGIVDELDWELERRGHRFARYADDCNIMVKSKRAGERALASVTHFASDVLRLTVHPLKSAVDRPWKRKFLGFTVSRGDHRLKVADKAIITLKDRIREQTRRTRGRTIEYIASELRKSLLGWKAYFDIAEVLSPLRDIDKWIRRKLRCYLWKQWGQAGYRNLRKRGVSVRDAWNTSKSAHGPWRLSKTPALAQALPLRYFDQLGIPSLAARKEFNLSNRRGT